MNFKEWWAGGGAMNGSAQDTQRAVWNDAMEEAALLVESAVCTSSSVGPLFGAGWNQALPHLAERIRGLKG